MSRVGFHKMNANVGTMMNPSDEASLSAVIGRNLPYLRRYGRALTGNQISGDRFAATTLEALLEDISGTTWPICLATSFEFPCAGNLTFNFLEFNYV